jgi:hypothetical protein
MEQGGGGGGGRVTFIAVTKSRAASIWITFVWGLGVSMLLVLTTLEHAEHHVISKHTFSRFVPLPCTPLPLTSTMDVHVTSAPTHRGQAGKDLPKKLRFAHPLCGA